MKRRITRVTTKSGDQGTTSLADGTRIEKNHPRMHAIGTVDELNSALGLLVAHFEPDLDPLIATFAINVQQSLFDLGGSLAYPGHENFPAVAPVEVETERLNSTLPTLTEFVLPGGTKPAAYAHLCRTLCRRAERLLWDLPEATQPGATYLNRLSDYFFVLARSLNQGQTEAQWRGPQKPQ